MINHQYRHLDTLAAFASSTAGYASPTSPHGVALLRQQHQRYVTSVVQHEKTHVDLFNTTALGYACKIIGELVKTFTSDQTVKKHLSDLFRTLISGQVYCQEFAATYSQYLHIIINLQESGDEYFNGISDDFYRGILQDAKKFVADNSIKSPQIDNTVLTLCQAAMNTDILNYFSPKRSCQEVVTRILQSDCYLADERFKSMCNCITEEQGVSFNKMLFDNSSELGKALISSTPSGSPIASASREVMNAPSVKNALEGFVRSGRGQLEYNDLNAAMRVRDGAIFGWLSERGFSVEKSTSETADQVNGFVDKFLPNSALPRLEAFDGRQPPRPRVHIVGAKNSKLDVSYLKNLDGKKLRGFLAKYIEKGDTLLLTHISNQSDNADLFMMLRRGQNFMNDAGQIFGLDLNADIVYRALEEVEAKKVFLIKFDCYFPNKFFTLNDSIFVMWAGNQSLPLDAKIPGTTKQTGLFSLRNERNNLLYIVRTFSPPSFLIMSYGDPFDVMEGMNEIGSIDELVSLSSLSKDDFSAILYFLNELRGLDFDPLVS